MAVLLPALNKARAQAKRIVCLNGLKQLVTAWMVYADNSDSKLVNGGQAGGSPFYDWVTDAWWCTPLATTSHPLPTADAAGTGWFPQRYDWDITGGVRSGVALPYKERELLLTQGALFKYAQNVKIYRCPEADKTVHRTYIMPTSMNAAWYGMDTSGYPYNKIAKRLGQITRSKERVVFFEEKNITSDAFEFPDGMGVGLCDVLNITHGNGANFGFADGHADYHKWECPETIQWCKIGMSYNATVAGDNCFRTKDRLWIRNVVWGN
jgi:prepilin-type processing-associated H-X9-DG protein